jgi:hypothetical protein
VHKDTPQLNLVGSALIGPGDDTNTTGLRLGAEEQSHISEKAKTTTLKPYQQAASSSACAALAQSILQRFSDPDN